MRIVACVKQVPDTSEVRMNPKTNTLDRKGVPSVVNPFDLHAVEEAVRIKEKVGGEVILLSMGPPQAEAALKKAMTLGADRAILLTDRAFAGSDTLATTYALARAIRVLAEEEPVKLVLCGKQAIDGDTGQVGPGLAARLGFSQLTYVSQIEDIDSGGRQIVVHRKIREGRAVLRSRLPAVVTVVKDINQPRYAPLPNLIRAARYQVEVWDSVDLGLEKDKVGLKGSPTWVSRIFAPPARPGGEIIPGGMEHPEAAAAALADKLVAYKVIANK